MLHFKITEGFLKCVDYIRRALAKAPSNPHLHGRIGKILMQEVISCAKAYLHTSSVSESAACAKDCLLYLEADEKTASLRIEAAKSPRLADNYIGI